MAKYVKYTIAPKGVKGVGGPVKKGDPVIYLYSNRKTGESYYVHRDVIVKLLGKTPEPFKSADEFAKIATKSVETKQKRKWDRIIINEIKKALAPEFIVRNGIGRDIYWFRDGGFSISIANNSNIRVCSLNVDKSINDGDSIVIHPSKPPYTHVSVLLSDPNCFAKIKQFLMGIK